MIVKKICGIDMCVNCSPGLKRLKLRVSLRHNPPLVLNWPVGVSSDVVVGFINENRSWIVETLTRSLDVMKREQCTMDEYASFYELLQERAKYWSEKMGLDFERMTMRMMSSRWGSCCKARRSISINSRLAAYPVSCLDYVLVHELAHLVHANHSALFWGLVERYCPDYKAQRAILRGKK